MKRLLLCLMLCASTASAQFFGPKTWQIPVAATNFSTLGSSPSTNLHDTLNWIDDNWPQFDSSSYLALNPTQDSLRVLSAWLDANWPDRAGRLYADTNGFGAISGLSSNLQHIIGSIDSQLVLRATNAYPRTNPSNYVTSADVFAQPMAIFFRSTAANAVTQLFGAVETDMILANASTSGPASYIFLTNGMVHTHAGTDSVTVPTGGWYLAVGQVAGTLFGPQDATAASFDVWITRDGDRYDGSSLMPGARSWLQVIQTSDGSNTTVYGRWFKQNGAAFVYASPGSVFSLSGIAEGTAVSAKVTYVSLEMRRIAP